MDRMTKRKKVIVKIAVWMFAVLLLFTIISQIIQQKLLPKVEIAVAKPGKVESTTDVMGFNDYTEKSKLVAKSDFILNKIVVPDMIDIEKGEILLKVDVSQEQIAVKQFELAILTLSNQLKQAELSPDKVNEQQLQLDILKQELAMFENSQAPNNELKKEQLKLQIKQIEQQINHRDTDISMMELLNTQLKIARDELQIYETNVVHQDKIATDRLSLAISQAQSQLKIDLLSQDQVSELKKQLEIANDQLKAKRSSFPSNGAVTSFCNGKVVKYYVKEGDRIVQGQQLADIASDISKKCVSFKLSKEAGEEFPTGSKVTIRYKTYKTNKVTGQTASVSNETVAIATHKKYLQDENVYLFSAPYDNKICIPTESDINVRITKPSCEYNITIPKACVIKSSEGYDCIYLIKKKQGLFSEEKIVKKIYVEVLESNNINVAIRSDEILPNGEVLLYTSKTIKDGSVISVVEE